jgi:hypothetical protein
MLLIQIHWLIPDFVSNWMLRLRLDERNARSVGIMIQLQLFDTGTWFGLKLNVKVEAGWTVGSVGIMIQLLWFDTGTWLGLKLNVEVGAGCTEYSVWIMDSTTIIWYWYLTWSQNEWWGWGWMHWILGMNHDSTTIIWYRYLTLSRIECSGWGWMNGMLCRNHAPGLKSILAACQEHRASQNGDPVKKKQHTLSHDFSK